MNMIRKGLSFDDVLLIPAESNITPKRVALKTQLTKGISLNIPLLSAAMDTVTESRMAVALAREGGIGIIHKNLTVGEQAGEVEKVKRSQSGVITSPISLSPDKLVKDAVDLMARYHISGIPITEENGKLLGILTNRDLRFQTDYSIPLGTAMTSENIITAGPGTSLEDASRLLHRYRIEKLPIVDQSGILVGLITFKDIMKARDYPHSCKDDTGRLRVGAAVSSGGESELPRVQALVDAGVDVVVVDSAHGHNLMIGKSVGMIKHHFPSLELIAGNIVTAEAADHLIKAGADALKVGVGPGSICTTRVVAGVGVPQLTAVLDTVERAKKSGIPVIADGGIKFSGDIVKSIAAGADSVMIGNLFAGTAESPGKVITHMGRNYKVHRGMGSVRAMERGSRSRYMQDDVEASKLVPEGIEGRVPYRGSLAEYVHQLMGGLRSGMGYCGTASIGELHAQAQFIQVTQAGILESHPHDITITEEPLNYHIS